MEKTIKYLENGEYHYATVRSVGDLAQLKTDSKETLVEAINELWNGGGNADPSKAPKPEGYDQLVQDVADAVKNQQEINQQWTEWQKEDAQLTEERKQAYLQAMKEMQESIDKAKADAAALDKKLQEGVDTLNNKTSKLDEEITKTFSDLDTSIQNMHEQLQKEADRMNQDLQDTKGTLSTLRTDLQNTQMDNGRIHDELTNINGKFEHKVWQTDLDPLKEQIDRAETSVQQTKDELLGKASRQDLDTVSNTVSKLDTQLKETAKGVEISVKKDELGGEIAEALTNKTNILLGTRRFTTNNWTQRDHVEICSDPWKGFLVAKQNSPIEGIQQAYDVKAGTTYTFSLFAKMDNLDDSNKPQITLVQNNLDTSLDTKIDVWRKAIDDITSDFKRYDLTFTPSEDCTIYPHVISNSNNPIFVCGYQLEIGKELTPWEPNQEDVGDYVEKSEAQFNVYNDKIQALTEKQRQQGDTQEKLRTEVTQTAEGVKQVSESLKDTNGDITKLRGDLERTADHMKSEYESYTNKAVGQISDSTLNLIRNSSFQNKDEDFAQWQNISAKANIRQDENGLRWVELTQSGLTTDNPQGITSNYFNVKQGKVTVAVDIKSGDKASLDNESVLFLELYNDAKKRVDFYDVSLSQLGLSKELLGDHKVHRGLYRLGIDRNDAKYMTVKAKLVKNGDLYFTNFSARLSSIDDGAYEPNPDDINHQILKQNTKIEQNAKEVAIKANSVDVTRDIKSAVDGIQVGGRNLVAGTNQEYIMGYGIPNTIWKDGFAYATLPTTGTGAEILPQDQHSFWYTLDPDQEYTQTIWFQTDASIKDLNAAQITWFTWGGHDPQPATIQRIGQNSYKLFSSYKWPGKNNNDVRLFDISELRQAFDLNTGTYLKFGKLKLEEGNKSTSWSPAPEDTSAEIKSAKDAAIQVASDQINIHVNELTTSFDDKLNKRVNEVKTASEKFTSDGIEQTVTKITNVKNDVDRLDQRVATNNGGGINLLRGTGSEWKTLTGADWFTRTTSTGSVSAEELNVGETVTYTIMVRNNSQYAVYPEIIGYVDDAGNRSFGVKKDEGVRPGETRTISMSATIPNNTKRIIGWLATSESGAATFSVDAKNEKLERGSVATPWSPNPQDAKTYTDSQIVNTNKKIDTQTLDSANIDDLKTQGHYFVRNLTGNPIGGWVYVDVTGNNNDRVRQDVYADQNNQHKYRSWNGSRWSDWEQGAYLSDVNSLKTEVTASVKNLGDRVTTEVNSITTRQDNFENDSKMQHSNDVELVRKSDFEDGSKGGWTVTGVVSATNPAPPAELGQAGMKVLQTNVRDSYEEGIWYSVKPGEKFDVDFWCAPSPAFHTTFGLVFYDKNKQNPNWQGINSDQSGQWKHYTGTITAPANASFAKPWYQMEKPANNTENSSWIAKPSIRRQNPQVAEKISELNTKWEVANGQIQGKVTETQVNNILNGKGYATQSWAQSNFRMKSDSISLEVKEITDPISSEVNNVNSKLDNLQVGGTNLLQNSVGPFQPRTDRPIDNYDEYPDSVVKLVNGEQYTISGQTNGMFSQEHNTGQESDKCVLWLVDDAGINQIISDENTAKGTTFTWEHPTKKYVLRVNTYHPGSTNQIRAWKIKIEKGNKATDWSPAPEDTSAEIRSAKDDAINVASGKIENSSKELQGQISSAKDSAENRAKELESRLNTTKNELQGIKDITQWHTVGGPLDLNDLKNQTRIFYRDTQDKNSAVNGWQYIVVDSSSDRVTQTVWKDNSTIQYIRQFTGTWTNWVRQINQNDIDEAKTGLREEIKSAKDAAINVAKDNIEIKVNELKTTYEETLNTKINEVKTASEKFTSDGIEQTVKKITDVKNQVDGVNDRVNNLKVGTSNLLHHSDTFDGWYKGALTNISGKYLNGNVATLGGAGVNGGQITTNLDGPYDDQPVTWTVYAKADFAGDKLHTELWGGGGLTEQSLTTDWKLYKFSGQRNVNHPDFYLWGVTGNKGNIYVALPFAVVGNTIGTWTPNTEDVDSKFQYKEVTGAIDFNDLKAQQKIFYKDTQARNSPAGGIYWYFVDVDVEPGSARIIQTATSDRNNITWKRTFADTWTAWQKQASQGDVDALRTETTASVKNLGDRVTTEVNSVTTKMSDQIANAVELIQKSDFSDGSKGSWTVQSIISATNPAPPAELGISGMKVIQSNVRDSYEDVWHSVTPGEKFNVDFWCAPSGVYDSSFGLVFYDANKNLVPNNQWLGVRTDHSGQWKHYTGEITAPDNSAFAKPWFQIDMPADYHNTSWLAKPHIRRQDPRVTEAIKTLNTKWDVANGQIQGKVTATDVNNILNGKGYATQSWAQTMFTMKSDAITLQAVRDNITNGIQNQVNDQGTQINNANTKINETTNRLNNMKIGGTNLLKGTSDVPRRLQGSGYLCKTTANDIYTPVSGYHTGDQFTYSATITNNSNRSVSLEMWLFKEKGHDPINVNSHSQVVPPHAQNQRVSATIEITSETCWIRTYVIYSDGKGTNDESVDVSNEKLEYGNVATTWSLNPNDSGNGVNLLRGTADFSWPTGIGTYGTVNLSYERFDDTTITLHISGSQGGGIYTKWGDAFPDGQIQIGEQYTFSFDIKGSGTFNSVKNEGDSLNLANGVTISNSYERVKVVGTIKELNKAFIIYFNGAFDAWIKNVKIERGTVATPWTPHPFDDKDKGVNLLKSTAYWNPADWNHISDGQWYDDNWTDNLGHKAYGHHTAWQGLGQTVYVTPGVYTWSAQIYLNGLDSNDYVYPYMGDSRYNGTVQVQDIRKPMLGVNDQNKWINYSATFYVKNAGNLCVHPELNRDHGTIHIGSQKLEHGMVATPWSPSPYDSDPQNIVSAINITPDQIKIASNKIVIDGNTDIHGTLRVPDVKLAGRNGNVDLSGDGINITKTNGAGINIASNGIQLTANTNGQNEIEGVITTAWNMNNKNQNGIGLILTTEQELGRPYGGDILAIGSMPSLGKIHAGMVFDATGITPEYKKGFNWFAPHTLNGDGGVLRFPGAQDDLMLYPGNMPESRQSNYSQPTLRLVHGNSQGSAGIQFQWDDIVPFGRITSSMSYVSAVGTDDDGGITVSWYSYGAWYNGRKAPSIVYRGSDGNRGNGGIVFYPYGEVCFWQGDFHSNLRWSGMKNTD